MCLIVFKKGEYIAAVQLGLQALIEALPRDSRFALVTFSDKIGLYNLTCTVPHVTYIGVDADANAVPQPSLAALLPLQLGAVPLHSHETRISQAITSLIGASVSHSAEKRAFGAALDLVLDYVLPAGSPDAADLLNVRVSCFLAGGINYGLGSAGLEPRAAPAAAAAATVDDPDLLRPLSTFFACAPSVPRSVAPLLTCCCCVAPTRARRPRRTIICRQSNSFR
jgi:hypothetical protein